MRRVLFATLSPVWLLSVCLSACGDLRESYGKEYVLYDSKRNEAQVAAKADAGLTTAGTPDAFARILLLEHVRGELERAILDGLDHDGELAAKRRDVEAELRARIDAAGPALTDWRAARVRALARFETQR